MTTLDTVHFAPKRAFLSRFTYGVSAFWTSVRMRWQDRQAKAYLSRLDVRLLEDIGLDAAEIGAIARKRGDAVEPWRYHADLD